MKLSVKSDYAARADIQDRVKSLRDYLRRGAESESLFNRLMALWASGKLPGLLEPGPRQAIVDAAFSRQQEDGGWTTSALAPWKRQDGTALDITSDGFATGLITFVLQQAGTPRTEPHVRKGLAWLVPSVMTLVVAVVCDRLLGKREEALA